MENIDNILFPDKKTDLQPLFESAPRNIDPDLGIEFPDQYPATQKQFYESTKIEPDRAAKVINLSKQLNEPEIYVDHNLATLEEVSRLPDTSYFKQLEEQYPGTVRFLLKDKNMLIARDDIDNLSWHERIIDDSIKGYRIGEINERQAELGWDQLFETISTGKRPTIHIEELASLKSKLEQYNKEPKGFRPFFWAGQQVPNLLLVAKKSAERAVETAGIYGVSGAIISGGSAAIPSALAGLPTGATIGALEASAMLEGGSAFLEYIDLKDQAGNPVDPRKAAAAAMITGGINAGLEVVSLKALSKTIPGFEKALSYVTKDIPVLQKLTTGAAIKNALKAYVTGIGTETGTEIGQELVTSGLGQVLTGEVKPKELATRAAGVINPAIQSSMLFGFPGTSIKIAGELRKVNQAVKDKEVYTNIGDNAENSKTRKRSPDIHAEYIKDTLANTPVENIYIPQEQFNQYFQSKEIDPLAVAKEIGVTDSYNEAVTTNGDIKIPMSNWVDKVVGTEHYRALADDIKFNPEGITNREKSSIIEEVNSSMKVEQEKAQELIVKSEEKQKGYDNVYNYIKEEQEKIVKPENISIKQWSKVIDDNAKLWASHAVAESARQNISVDEWFQGQNRPTVENSISGLGETLAQTVYHGTIHDFDTFKLDNIGSGTGNQTYGYGLYFSDKKSIAEWYKKRAAKNKEITGVVYKVSIPENEDLLNLDLKIKEQSPKIRKALNAQMELYRASDGAQGIYINDNYTGDDIYKGISFDLGSGELASKKLLELGIPGLSYESASKEGPANNFVIFDDKLAKIEEKYYQDRRAQVLINGNKSIISLFKIADQSSFMHESAHIWLQDTLNFVKSGKADEKYLADWQDLKTYLEYQDTQESFTPEQQEKFAKAFEYYLANGVAPSDNLRPVFRRFKQWITRIYKDIVNIGVEVPENITKVLDRMLATEEEISKAESELKIEPSKQFTGIPDSVSNKIDDIREKARDRAERYLLAEQMQEISNENEKVYNEALELTKENITAEVEKRPVYIAMDSISKEFRKGAKDIAASYLNNKMKDESRSKFDIISEALNYESGSVLADEIIKSPFKSELINNLTKESMKQFAPLKDTALIREKALNSLHNNYSLELLGLEYQILNEMINTEISNINIRKINSEERKVKTREIKAKAEEIIFNKKVGDIVKTSVYYTAERKAAVNFAKAMARNDLKSAIEYKDQQMLNHALAIANNKAKKLIESDIAYLKKQQLIKLKSFNSVQNFNQVAAILQKFGFGRNDYNEAGKTQSLEEWIKEKEESTNIVMIQPWIYNDERNFIDYNKDTFSKLHEVVEAIKNIRRVDSFENKVLTLFDKIDFNTQVKNLVQSQQESWKKGRHPERSKQKSWLQKISDNKLKLLLSNLNINTLTRGLDGYKDNGPWFTTFKLAADRASTQEIDILATDAKVVKKLLSVYSPKELKAMEKNRLNFEGLAAPYTKMELIAMGLNWGAKVNRERLAKGEDITVEQMNAVLMKYLDKRDWDFIQGIWNLFESRSKEISDVFEKISGFPMQRKEIIEVNTPHGKYKGGYYPLKADSSFSNIAKEEEQKIAAGTENALNYWKTLPRNGFTKETVKGASYIVSKDIGIINRHIQETAHYISHTPLAIDLNKLLSHPEINTALRDAYGEDGPKIFKDWASNIFGDTKGNPTLMRNKIFRILRDRVVIHAMVGRLTTAFSQLGGFINAGSVDRNFTHYDAFLSIINFSTNAITDFGYIRKTKEEVFRDSKYMQHRASNYERDVNDVLNRLSNKDSKFLEFFKSFISTFDAMVSIPIWLQAKKKGINLFNGDERRAKEWADTIVYRSQGSGLTKDLAQVLRGDDTYKFFTMFLGYYNTTFNAVYENYDQIVNGEGGTELIRNIGNLTALTVVTVIANEALSFRLAKEDDEDEEKYLKRILATLVTSNLSYFPGVRELAPVLVNKTLGLRAYDYRVSPITNVAESIFSTLDTIKSERSSTEDVLKKTSKITSYLLRYPDQVNVWIWNTVDILSGDMNPRFSDILKIRPKGERL